MSTTTESTSNLDGMTSSPLFHTPESFQHVITHVFLPLELPEKNDCTLENNLSLAGAVCAAAHAYTLHICGTFEEGLWHRITKMLNNLRASIQSDHVDADHIISQLRRMETGDIITFFVRPQNATIILTKRENSTLFESFEVSPREDAVEKTPGSLICSYPWSAVETPNEVFEDEDFQSEFGRFLSLPVAVDSDLPRPPPAQPEYITALLSGILRCLGRTADVTAISKRIRDNVGKWPFPPDPHEYRGDWRRSALWLLIRVAIQMSVERSSTGRASYKHFILYFVCTLARNGNNVNLSSDLLHLMSSKIFRRLNKLSASAPDWLSKTALQTCTRLREILDARWNELRVRPSPFHNPSQEQLAGDTRLSLLSSREYIRKVISTPDHVRLRTPFYPNHRRRGTLKDFLSLDGTFFDEAYCADPEVTMHDVEQSIEEEIDDWIANVAYVNDACMRLDILMDQYQEKSKWKNPEYCSIKILTMLELFIAIDKLGVQEIPMLADYSPGIPIEWLEQLFLHKTANLHRLSCIHQYLVARKSRSRPGWSVLSGAFTQDSFPVRYYDHSKNLQRLKARIEQEAKDEHGDAGTVGQDGFHEQATRQLPAQDVTLSRPPLPTSPLHAKGVVFELQCPPCFRTLRSAVARISHYIDSNLPECIENKNCYSLLADLPELQPYLVSHQGPPLSIQVLFVYFHPYGLQPGNTPEMRYLISHSRGKQNGRLRPWRRQPHLVLGYTFQGDSSNRLFKFWIKHNSTFHTSNSILAGQADCPADTPIDEFIAFIHLRSGGSLQWLNILKGLHNRSLNLRDEQVHFLLAQAVFQVGPLNLDTMTWIWHEGLQDMSFCNALIDELDTLFMDGVGLIDDVFMSTISLLLTRILQVVSNLGVQVWKQAVTLLRRIRRKTFSWVQELSYGMQVAPMNEERRISLLRMAATCRSMFNVDHNTLPRLIDSAEDVDALLSCSFFIQALCPSHPGSTYLRLLCERDSYFTPTLEETARNTVLADPSNRGVDLAIARIFASYRPSAFRLEPLQYPSARWLTCNTNAIQDQPSQMVHINLLDGQLRVDSQPFGRLPQEIRDHQEYRQIFSNSECFAIPSDLPGMDFMTFTVTANYKVHFSLQNDNLVIRAQSNQTKEVLQFIPSEILQEDLPPALTGNRIHWLNTSSGVIEIRYHQKCWEPSVEDWRIDCASESYCAQKGHELLVDVQSPTWAMLSECLKSLGVKESMGKGSKHLVTNIIITTCSVDSVQSMPRQQLVVTLPGHALSFFVNNREELESRDFQNMVYDEDQCIQTLLGLDLLVLRSTNNIAGFSVPEALISRIVLVPDGCPKRGGSSIECSRYESYHTFEVDPELGCLVRDGNLKSIRLLAHLHATSSLHRPDPLSDKLGTQAACDLLWSAGCRSIMHAKALDDDIESYAFGCSWSSTKYHQLNAMHYEIQDRYYWNVHTLATNAWNICEKHAARRAVHLFPSSADRPMSLDTNDDYDYAIPNLGQELEEVAFVVSSVAYRWSNSTSTMDPILNWIKIWSVNVLVDSTSKPDDGPDAPDSALESMVRNILEKRAKTYQQFQFLFLLPLLAYCLPSQQAAFLSILMAFAPQTNSCSNNTLVHTNHRLSYGYRPAEQVIRDYIHISRIREELDPSDEKAAVNAAISHLLSVWPTDSPPTISMDSFVWNTEQLAVSLQQMFISCYHNWNLKERLVHILTVELGLPCPHHVQPSPSVYISDRHVPLQITLDQLLSSRTPPGLPQRSTLSLPRANDSDGLRTPKTCDDIPALDHLFSSLRTNTPFQQEYLAVLETNASVGKEIFLSVTHRAATLKGDSNTLQEHYMRCRTNYTDAIGRLKKTLGPMTNIEQALEQFGQWPSMSADVLLRCLATTSRDHLSDRWKQCLVSFAQLLLELQRARRLLRFMLDNLKDEFQRELENEQCDGWNPEEYPDWLLIQIQGDFLIRRAQAETAIELMFPRSGGNTVMQVNMGEGKSSVIIPIVAAALADGKQLVRVIIPKALTIQMFDILVARLGGLANRPIYHLPFSRTAYNNHSNQLPVKTLHELMSQCMAEHGILLVQPEHVVSLKLMATEKQIYGGHTSATPFSNLWNSTCQRIMRRLSLTTGLSKYSLVDGIFRSLGQSPNSSTTRNSDEAASDDATEWLSLQKWVHSNVRDILDESDEILHPRFQLIYTIGLEQHMDWYPIRWTITQQILRLVKEHVHTLSRNHPNSVEYERGTPGSFPQVRIARTSDVGQRLISMVVEDVMAGQLLNFNFRQISSTALRGAIRSFISDPDVLQVSTTAKTVEEYAKCSHQTYLWNGLLLLRGLLSSNVLLFALSERRWRVDYGLWLAKEDPNSIFYKPLTMLAVPYRAKDVPAPDTQFGHPDLTIILTCLSYYYAGLTEEQLRASFELLLDMDDPTAEYESWIEDCRVSLPDSLLKLRDVNPRSSEEWDKVTLPLFSHNQAVINFYLSRVVFPKEAKEFPWKLCGSSWDLGERRERLVTGFSGTSDGRWLLPMSVVQYDIDHQRGASASVLARLLRQEQGEESVNYIVTHKNGERQTQTAEEFLKFVAMQRPEIRVLLDVGAQILDLSNVQVAGAWLDIVRDAEAAIYFDENDDLTVLPRNGGVKPLSSSPFSQQLGKCVVYLDHPHTRGTDLKFPIGSRAAVTLGPKVTKDALVQGCMRMRKLGHGHTVIFFAPPGVDNNIRTATGKQDRGVQVTISDVLSWTIQETWADIKHRAPYWAQQGIDHHLRYDTLTRFYNDELQSQQLSDVWLQPNCKSLADLYAPRESVEDARIDLSVVPGMQQQCKVLGILSLPDGQLEEEQELEVHREREREREAELPPKAEPADHYLHPDVVSFVESGVIPSLHSSNAFLPVFTTLERSIAATRDADVWSPNVLATADFGRTVKPESTKGTMDQYLRPVQWILSSRTDHGPVLVILSPFEAGLLMPDIRASKHVHLHVYAPRTAERVKPSDDLRLYAIPPLPSDWTPPWELIDQLNIFAGQLYLRDYQSYLRLCRFLDVPTNESLNDGGKPRRNLFQIPGTFEEMEVTFTDSPLPTVMALLAIRNRGRPFDHTHMGKILQGQILTEKDFKRTT